LRVRRVVLDTNVVLDCWVFADPAAQPLRAALEAGRLVVVRSAATDAELADVLARPFFALDQDARAALIAHWKTRGPLIDGVAAAPIRCKDPDDQKFLDLALTARADALFTKDRALLATAARARAHALRVLPPYAADSMLFFEDRVA
jgi:putative PIN family toxin of toxin-antitoxin system